MARKKRRSAAKTPSPSTQATSEDKQFLLSITLKSDMCPGSGDGFSSGIDTDICFDAHGLPYIPARRIKGCLREAARTIQLPQDLVDLIFGTSGASEAGCIAVRNAQLKDAPPCDDVEATLERYTYVRAQTKVDSRKGAAEENTLRFTRVIKHYADDGVTENCFEAPIIPDFASMDGKTKRSVTNALRDASRALRNMGMGRNRGFGAVRCKLQRISEPETSDEGLLTLRHASDGMTTISYRVRLDAPMMLPQHSGTRSVDHVPGSSVYGFLAHKLRQHQAFEELFFGGRLVCSPLYPVDEAGMRCVPASPFVVKLKGGPHDGALREATSYWTEAERDGHIGESAKPMRDGFLSPTTWNPVTVLTQTIYHHSTGEDATLYTQTCLCEGQEFAGYVMCPNDYADVVANALTRGRLSFGRSKSAQYATCSLVSQREDYAQADASIDIVKGEKYVFLLDSDALLLDSEARYVTDYVSLKEALAVGFAQATGMRDAFGLSDAECPGATHPITSIKTKVIAGYNAKWNQKKPHIPAFGAGSCVAFEAQADVGNVPASFYIGERRVEGFGRVLLLRLASINPLNAQRQTEGDEAKASAASDGELLRQRAIDYAEAQKPALCGLNASFIGRVALMVREATEEEDLDRRLASIKNEEKRKAAQRLCEGMQTAVWQDHKDCLTVLFRLAKYYKKQSESKGAGDVA